MVRLFCLAHAGGGALAFRPWRGRLGDGIALHPVVLPGRESRWGETPYTWMDDLADGVLSELAPLLHGPYAFFGHSMGAAVAYELTRRLTERPAQGQDPPIRLLVSGRRPPHIHAPRNRRTPAHLLPYEDFLTYLRALGGVPPEVLNDRRTLDAFLPAMRADFEVNETYTPPRAPRLQIPVSAFRGVEDPAVTADDMRRWQEVTGKSCTLRTLPGGHFYLKGGPPELLEAIRDDLTGVPAGQG
ncbi:MAG: alpha/beta fold hydrolase [Streptosporangiales bacterium]|nr:alpha/beta fold hydrolase [Streptosporangiales bacterium]